MSKNKVNPGKGYRLLEADDIMRKSKEDEIKYNSESDWDKVDGLDGWKVLNRIVRRKIESPKGWNVTIHCKTRASARYLKACIINHNAKITKAND